MKNKALSIFYRARLFTSGIFLFLLLLLVQSPISSAEDDVVRITEAIDGETLRLSDGREVKLIGVKTADVRPILTERYKLSADQVERLPLGRLTPDAMDYINKHTVGQRAILSFDPANEPRKHLNEKGQVLAYLWYTTYTIANSDDEAESTKLFGITSQNRMLNQELVMMGYALADGSSPYLQKKLFLDYEKDAANSKQGFWRSAAEFYQSLLEKAKGAQFGSTAGFVGGEARDLSLKTAWDNYEKLIQMDPRDPRPYYQRSWLGADPAHDKVLESNLTDINQSANLSPFDPKVHMQRNYLLRLMGRHDEAEDAYAEAIRLAGKYGMPATVSQMVKSELHKTEWQAAASNPVLAKLALAGIRATYNEDHFLYFMARYQGYGNQIPDEAKKIYSQVSNMGSFEKFRRKHEALLALNQPHALLYKTQWGLKGLAFPQTGMRWIESIGEAPETVEDSANNPNKEDSISLENSANEKEQKQDSNASQIEIS